MFTPVNPSFTISKWGLKGSKLYRRVFMMQTKENSGKDLPSMSSKMLCVRGRGGATRTGSKLFPLRAAPMITVEIYLMLGDLFLLHFFSFPKCAVSVVQCF